MKKMNKMDNIKSKYQHTQKLFVLVLLMSLWQGCGEDFLTQYPKDQVTAGTFYKTEADYRAAINGVYDGLTEFMVAEFQPFMDMATPFCECGGGRFDVYKIGQTNGVININDQYSEAGKYWKLYYRGIGRANVVLANIDNPNGSTVSQTFKNRIKGEALFLRAYSYFNLVQLFGDVPLIVNTQSYDELLVSRTPKDQVYAQMIIDLTEAESNLPSVKTYRGTKELGRVSKGAAQSLLGKTYLYQQNWAKAEEWFEKVITSQDYQLVPHYVDQFWPTGENGIESIFEIQFSSVNPGNDLNRYQLYAGFDKISNTYWLEGFDYMLPTEYYCDQFETKNGHKVQGTFVKRTTIQNGNFNFQYDFSSSDPAFDPSKPYEIRDPRLKWTVWYENTPYITEDFMRRANMTGSNFSASYSERSNHCTVKYLTGMASPSDNSDMNMIVIRYADVLLMCAEAKLEQNKLPAAVALINQVRQRPSVNMPTVEQVGLAQSRDIAGNQANLRQYLREERYRELAFEWGHLYFDQVRWKVFDDEMVKYWTASKEGYSNPAFVWNERWWLWPLPASEREKNPNLVQNEGY